MLSKVRVIMGYVLGLYIFVLLMVVPFFMQEQYNKLGLAKFQIYRNASILFLGLMTCLSIVLYFLYCKKKKTWRPDSRFSVTDWFVLSYLAVVLLSYTLGSYKEDAFWGASGWYMGLFAQLTFVWIYFLVSRFLRHWNVLVVLGGASTTVVYLFAILHRFSIDPLRLHENLDSNVQLQFLSTLGQATWYSSFLCVCFPVAIGIYYTAVRWETKLLSGVYLVIAMASLVTQNSDSAFFALAIVLLVLFSIAFRSREYMMRFLEVVLLILFSFQVIGFLQRSFPDQAVELESLSMFMSQGLWIRFLFPVVLILYLVFEFWKTADMDELKFIRNAVLLLLSALLIGTVVFIWLNTNGFLFQKYGWYSEHNYLWFNDNWGSGRGSSWKLAWQAFCELPMIQKLVGVGPDSFGFYCYDQPVYERILIDKWGDSTLTNAHNEFLNSAICYGILGIAAYLGLLLSAFVRFLQKTRTAVCGSASVLLGAALVIVSYMGHNFFCYQQVLCTPYLFLMLGAGEAYYRKFNKS